ncbi:hypothetical protein XENTR_v10004136 [Xenopus tropicalis]|nr:hypothetical protein XENTR_v10004136 [Xenopus tropicalis]KAE8576292.1 hypothetical protein XENTR_v10004136 [Xenopus tropicalis]
MCLSPLIYHLRCKLLAAFGTDLLHTSVKAQKWMQVASYCAVISQQEPFLKRHIPSDPMYCKVAQTALLSTFAIYNFFLCATCHSFQLNDYNLPNINCMRKGKSCNVALFRS